MLKVIPLTLFHLPAHAFTVFGPPFVWNHSTCWAAALQTEDLNVAESPASALCSIRKLIVFDTISPREYFIFTLFLNGIISKSLIKGASTANTLMRETCHATVNGEIVTDWHVIESRLLAAMTLTTTTSREAYHRASEALWLAMDEVRGSTSVDFIMFKTKLIHCYTDGYD